MVGERRLCAPTAFAVTLLALALAPASSRAVSPLVLSHGELTALRLHPRAASARSARKQLGSHLPHALQVALRKAIVESAGASGHGARLLSDAVVMRSASSARGLVRAWRKARAGKRVAIGEGGALTVHVKHKQATAEVIWREHSRVGLIVFTAKGKAGQTRKRAISYAMLADADLRSPMPRTAWARVLSGLRSDGTMSKRIALRAFAAAYGPLPGVRRPRGARGGVISGTPAAQWALRYRSKMTAAQRRSVYAALGLPQPRKAKRARIATLEDPGFHEDAHLEAIAQEWAGVEGARLGRPLGLQVVAGKTSTHVVVKKGAKKLEAYADSLPLNANDEYGSGTPAVCRVRVTAAGLKQKPAFLKLILAHEVFHCFQFYIRGVRAWDPLPLWVGEGSADWAALTVDPVGYGIGGGNLSTYIGSPHTPLFQRSYDAVGFWGHLQDVDGDLWARMPSILLAGDSSASEFANTGASGAAFFSTWGSSLFHLAGAGAAWQMTSPITPLPTVQPPIGQIEASLLGSGGGHVIAPPYTTSQYMVHARSSTPLLQVTINGDARLGSSENYTDLHNSWFCTSSSCGCPAGSTGSVPPTRPLALPARLALTGDPQSVGGGKLGTYGTVSAYPLSQFCSPTEAPSSHERAGASDLTASGAVAARGTEAGSCTRDEFGMPGELECRFDMYTAAGNDCVLELGVPEAYAGPRYYAAASSETLSHVPYVTFGAFSPCVGTTAWTTDWVRDTGAEAGGFTIDGGERSGSVRAVMNNGYEASGSTETVEGTFSISFVKPGGEGEVIVKVTP